MYIIYYLLIYKQKKKDDAYLNKFNCFKCLHKTHRILTPNNKIIKLI